MSKSYARSIDGYLNIQFVADDGTLHKLPRGIPLSAQGSAIERYLLQMCSSGQVLTAQAQVTLGTTLSARQDISLSASVITGELGNRASTSKSDDDFAAYIQTLTQTTLTK